MRIPAFIAAFILFLALTGCHLLHPVSPIPGDKVRKMHRISEGTLSGKELRVAQRKQKKWKKQQQKLAKQREKDAAMASADTTGGGDMLTDENPDVNSEPLEEGEGMEEPQQPKEPFFKRIFGKKETPPEEVDPDAEPEELEPEDQEPNKVPFFKRIFGKKGGEEGSVEEGATADEEYRDNQQRIEEGEFEGEEEEVVSTRSIRKEIRNADRAHSKEQKAQERASKKEARSEKRKQMHRSRVTPWWRLNQNPKIGQQWKKPNET